MALDGVPDMPSESCNDCVFFMPTGEQQIPVAGGEAATTATGFCRRFPPVNHVIVTQQRKNSKIINAPPEYENVANLQPSYALTMGVQWCGEHVAFGAEYESWKIERLGLEFAEDDTPPG